MVPPARIASLEQLDGLVGRYVMEDRPTVYWEHTYSHWRFETLPEALDALTDPFFVSLVPEAKRASLAVTEIREYPPYTADAALALRVVERLGRERRALTLSASCGRWAAAFGAEEPVQAPSAGIAIAIAALRVRGIEVQLDRELASDLAAAA